LAAAGSAGAVLRRVGVSGSRVEADRIAGRIAEIRRLAGIAVCPGCLVEDAETADFTAVDAGGALAVNVWAALRSLMSTW